MKFTVLITCVASQVIPKITELIRSFTDREIRIIGIDFKEKKLAVGAYFCDEYYRVPMGSDDIYIRKIEEIVKKEGVGLIFPGSDEEVVKLSLMKNLLWKTYNCKVTCSNNDVTSLASDKFLMLEKLSKSTIWTGEYSSLSTIKDLVDFAKIVDYPNHQFVIKPKVGRGSKGFKIVKDFIDEKEQFFNPMNFHTTLNQLIMYFEKYPEELRNYLVMEYFTEDKFSTDVLFEDGEIKHMVTRNNGIVPKTNPPTQLADIVIDEEVELYVKQLCSVISFDFFVQIETGKTSEGKVGYIETNPRLDATLPITEGAGVNYYHEMIKYALNDKIVIKPRKLINKFPRFFRYWEHVFIDV